MDDALVLTRAAAAGGIAEFSGRCFSGGPDRAFGGHIAAQALLAAHRTAGGDRHVHSLHTYFLAKGQPGESVRYDVDSVRDGGSYALRQVTAMQAGVELLTMTASFKRGETGGDRQATMPHAVDPEELPAQGDAADRFWSGIAVDSGIRNVVDVRPVDGEESGDPERCGDVLRRMWFRGIGPMPDDPALHAAGLTFLSDLTVARTAALGHLGALGGGTPRNRLFLASLDHAMWFHRPCRVDDWLLFVQRSRTSGDGRGLTCGEFWSRDGVLVATVSQEVLLRERRPA